MAFVAIMELMNNAIITAGDIGRMQLVCRECRSPLLHQTSVELFELEDGPGQGIRVEMTCSACGLELVFELYPREGTLQLRWALRDVLDAPRCR